MTWPEIRMVLLGATAVVLVVALIGCGTSDRSSAGAEDRFVRPGSPRSSASGSYTAYAEIGPPQHGVETWIVVVRDSSGTEVFRDSYAYSTRHGVGITWLTNADQLWVLSADVGDAHVDRNPEGVWTKMMITPETVGDVPEEIRLLHE